MTTCSETTIRVERAGIQRTLRSSSKSNDELEEEVALQNAEEHLMQNNHHDEDDEEIESCDEEGKPVVDTEKLERRMMTVALVKSVVETSGNDGSTDSSSDKKHSYGLRKRNLKSGNDSSDEEETRQPRRRKTQPLKKRSVPSATGGNPKKPRAVGNGSTVAKKQDAGPMQSSTQQQQQVPNPLLTSVNQPTTVAAAAAAASVLTGSAGPLPPVPCPLPDSKEESRPDAAPSGPGATVKATSTVGAAKRGRIFSIDIDPEGLEFPDMNIDVSMQPVPPGARIRSSSIEQGSQADDSRSTSVTFKNQGEHKDSLDVSLPSTSGGRGRAMSFEFFSFGINADEPLPPAPVISGAEVAPAFQRPRGDSIIFDPDSFRDGGVLEEHALVNKSRTASIDIAPEELALMNTPGFATVPAAPKGGSAPHHPGAPKRVAASAAARAASSQATVNSSKSSTNNNNSNVATLPSLLNNTSTETPSHTTFQMELLNKDGRIGIYLPEARKARIAKFHSKRKMRIWRKRIKYDCRKKLADSRPRIKGRFVKRSDMDE